MPCGAFSHAGLRAECLELTCALSAAGYDLLLKVEYKGRTLWDCAGSNPSDPANHPGCTVVPPGGLQAKLHLPVLTWPPCLPLTTNALATNAERACLCPGSICHVASAIQACAASLYAGVPSPLTGCKRGAARAEASLLCSQMLFCAGEHGAVALGGGGPHRLAHLLPLHGLHSSALQDGSA